MHRYPSLTASALATGGVVVLLIAGPAGAQSGNPGRDFNLQQYERRYDPGAYSAPTYHPQNPGQQYNQLQYERRYRTVPVAPPKSIQRLPSGESLPRVRSVKPVRKTDEQVRRAQKPAKDGEE